MDDCFVFVLNSARFFPLPVLSISPSGSIGARISIALNNQLGRGPRHVDPLLHFDIARLVVAFSLVSFLFTLGR